jgi:hypothetical protein
VTPPSFSILAQELTSLIYKITNFTEELVSVYTDYMESRLRVIELQPRVFQGFSGSDAIDRIPL